MPRAPRSLREFLERLEALKELARVRAPVSPELEITEIVQRLRRDGPALLFESVAGGAMPVAINLFGSARRMAAALGRDALEALPAELEALLDLQPPSGMLEKLRFLGLLHRLAGYQPKTVGRGACQEVVLTGEAASLDRLPILRCWPGDAGRYITLGVVFTKDPETGVQNAGLYRLQVFDGRTFGCHWQPHHDGARLWRKHLELGRPMEVAVAIGAPPAVTYASTAPLPPGVDETLLAGFLAGAGVELVRCRTVDLLVPAESEIVLEARLLPGTRAEGPFGDHTGHYTPPAAYPAAELTALTHRRDPIYQTTVVGRPPQEDYWLGKTTERLFLPLLRRLVPGLVELALPDFGLFHNWGFVSIRKRYPYQARQAMHALWGLGQLALLKFIVVVDDDVDVHDTAAVLYRLGQHVDPARDAEPARGPADALDHAGAAPGVGSKLGFDATRKLPEESGGRLWPEEIRMSEEMIRRVTARWKEYGLERG